MAFHSLSILLVSLLAFTVPARAETDLLDVRDFGAVGDGKADDTEAFRKAVIEGKKELRHVYVPRGKYLISDTIVLENIGITGPPVGAWPADVEALPMIHVRGADKSVFHLLAGGSLKGLDISHAWDTEPETGHPAILIGGIGVYVSNMRIRYAWDGIVTDGINNVGRLNIENVFMVSIRNVGVRVTGTWDVPRLNNIEVWNAGTLPHAMQKGIGFHLGKNDLIRITDCFVFAMQHGFLFEDRIEGLEIEGGTWGVMNGCSTDYCPIGIEVRGEHTLSVNGGTFWEHQQSLIVNGEKARVRVSGCEMKSNGAPVVEIHDCDHVVITGCSLLRPMEEFDAPAVVLKGGRTILTGNRIESYGNGIEVEEGSGPYLLQGNMIRAHGNEGIVIQAPESTQGLAEGNLIEQ